ncbi:MAG: SAM-dependent DNA methyltransferase [Armatimonadetes bacterium]|nr:SAM-dependent DNA methyltransferase [Armatimonadota bacterium]
MFVGAVGVQVDREQRRELGAFYTPPDIARRLLERTLGPILDSCRCGDELRNKRFLDPACGDGAFLRLADEMVRERLGCRHETVFGFDIDPVATRACGGLSVAQRDFLAEEKGGYDAIFGNPPFLSAIRAGGLERAHLGEGLIGSADLAYSFLAKALTLVKPASEGGRVGFVLPRAFLGARAAAAIRSRMPNGFRLESVEVLERPDHFDGAQVYVCLCVFSDSPTTQLLDEQGQVLATLKLESANWWGELFGDKLVPDSGLLVGEIFEVCQSMTVGEAYAVGPFIEDRMVPDARLLISGRIRNASCEWGEKPSRYLGTTYQHPTLATGAATVIPKRIALARRPKVVVAGLSKNLRAFFDPAGQYIGAVSTFTITHPRDDLDELQRLEEFLNTPLATSAFIRECGSSALGGGSITVRKDFLRKLVIPSNNT